MARDYLRRLSDALLVVQRPIRILKAINWDPRVREQFLQRGARELPRPEYLPLGYEVRAKVKELAALRRQIRGRNPIEALLREKCEEFARVAQMLGARGTRRFYELSRRIFGDPRDRFPDNRADNLAIARLWAARPRSHCPEPVITSAEAIQLVHRICDPLLGPGVKVVERARMTANAAAGATRITLRKGATFSPRQVRALAHHEGLWHVLTSMNGLRQPVLKVLGVGLPRHTESQEGGGIVAEFLTNSITDERYIELGERTIAIDMAARGADFLEVYRYLRARFPPPRAAQIAERVFRGGVIEGGAPFTKDASYQRGYCRAFNFLRAALERGDQGLVRAFLAGKISVDDAELVRDLIEEGICVGPAYLPEWFIDWERLSATMTHSVTLNRFSLPLVTRYYALRRRRMSEVQPPLLPPHGGDSEEPVEVPGDDEAGGE